MTIDYKKYSLEHLENWLHDAMSSDEATSQEIYDVIIGVVKENYYHHKDQTSRAYELLCKLNGHPTEYNWLDKKFDERPDYYKNVMPSTTQRDTNKYCKAYDLDNQVCLDDTIDKLQNTILWPPEKEKSDKSNLSCDKDDPSPECKGAWNDFWEDVDNKPADKVVRWKLPVEVDGLTGECYVNFPDDLLEAADLKEGDQVQWIDNHNGSFILKKVSEPLGMDEC